MLRPGLTYSRGLLTIAASLERSGFRVIYAVYPDPVDQKYIFQIIKDVDAVGITVITPTFNHVISLCDWIKKINPNVKIVLGGPHVSCLGLEILQACKSADLAMIGECEERFPELLKSITCPNKISGVIYRNEDGIVQQSEGSIMPVNVAELPMPAYHLLRRPLSEYAHNIRTTRGCPYNCNFCFERLTSNKLEISAQPTEKIIHEIDFLSKHLMGNTLIHFSDAIFNLYWNDYTAELVDKISKKTWDFLFSLDTRIDSIEKSQVSTLFRSNFVCFRMGFESTQNYILKQTQKRISSDIQLQASDIIRSVSDKIAIYAYALTGLPGSTPEIMELEINNLCSIVRSNLVDIVSNKIFVPYPCTHHFLNPTAFGIEILTRDWSKYDRRSPPVYRLKDLSENEIYAFYLLSEASLVEEYKKKLNFQPVNLSDVRAGLDYLYSNYVGN